MKKKKKPPRPGVRSLKIQSKYRQNLYRNAIVPELKLCGRWLEELGFTKESRVNVYTSQELIVIRPSMVE